MPFWGKLEKAAITGRGIDIGCGPDPVTASARRFDMEHGDANEITRYVNDQFDFVYSSHCLEHMHDPRFTILDWWKLVRPGGYLFVTVPDEDLYEQGIFPSKFNTDHKATFTISKARSWSPVSHNVLELAQSLPDGQLLCLILQDAGYDRTLMAFGNRTATIAVRFLAKAYGILARVVGEARLLSIRRILVQYFPVDQTSQGCNAQAQIQLIVKKMES